MIRFARLNKKEVYKIIIAAAIPIVVGIVLLFFVNKTKSPAEQNFNMPSRNDTVPAVSILINYGTKIVYTTDVTTSKDDYVNDCRTRKGTFNACGNTCKPGSETCAATCAFTCEIK